MLCVWHIFTTWRKAWVFETLICFLVHAQCITETPTGAIWGLCPHHGRQIPNVQSGTGSLRRTVFIRSFPHTSLCCQVCSRMETSSKPINRRNVGEEVRREERIAPNIIIPPNLSGLSWDSSQKQTSVNRGRACVNQGSTCIWSSLKLLFFKWPVRRLINQM